MRNHNRVLDLGVGCKPTISCSSKLILSGLRELFVLTYPPLHLRESLDDGLLGRRDKHAIGNTIRPLNEIYLDKSVLPGLDRC